MRHVLDLCLVWHRQGSDSPTVLKAVPRWSCCAGLLCLLLPLLQLLPWLLEGPLLVTSVDKAFCPPLYLIHHQVEVTVGA